MSDFKKKIIFFSSSCLKLKKIYFTAFLNASLLVTFLTEIGKLFQSLIELYEKLLVLHKFSFGVIQFKLEAPLVFLLILNRLSVVFVGK